MGFYNVSTQTREWNVGNIFKFFGIFQTGKGWNGKESLSVVKGKKAECNLLEVLQGILKPDTKYDCGEQKLPGSTILKKVDAYLAENKVKKCSIVSDGRHRAVALMLAQVFGGNELTVNEYEIAENEIDVDSFEQNVKHDLVTKLGKLDKLNEVIGLIQNGKVTKEADLEKLAGITRYQAQEFFARAMLVRNHKFTPEEALAPSKEDARKASTQADARAYLDANAKQGKNVTKAVESTKIREMHTMMKEAGEVDNLAYQVLDAIATGDTLRLRDICFGLLPKGDTKAE